MSDSEDVSSPPPVQEECVSYCTAKVSIFLFILFIFINSDVFIDRVMRGISHKYVEGRHPTTMGIVFQGVVLCIMFVILDCLVSHDII